MVGLVLRDWSKVYSFCHDSVFFLEKKFQRLEEEYCLSVYDLYVRFVRTCKIILKFYPR